MRAQWPPGGLSPRAVATTLQVAIIRADTTGQMSSMDGMRRRRTSSARDRPVALLTAVIVALSFAATVGLASAAPPSTLSQLTGRLLIANGDTFGGRPIVLQTSLRTASGVVPLRIPPSQRARMVELAGKQVRARGTRAHGAFNVASLASASPGRVATDARLRAPRHHVHCVLRWCSCTCPAPRMKTSRRHRPRHGSSEDAPHDRRRWRSGSQRCRVLR